MTLIRWEPRRDIETAQRRIRQVMDNFDSIMQNGMHLEMGTFLPRIDVAEDEKHVYVTTELPGLTANDVKITLTDGILTIRGEKKRSEEYAKKNFHRIERTFGEFVRQLTLPDSLNEEAIEASFTDGVLEIMIPKQEAPKPKEREIKIGATKKAEPRAEQQGSTPSIS